MASYIIIGGDSKEYGPVSDADLRLWISEGRLNGDSRVKAESDAEFRSLAQFPEFAAALQQQPVAPAPAAPANPEGVAGDWQAEVLARDAELKFGECLAAGWRFLGANAGFLAGAIFLTWVPNFALVFLSVTVPVLGPLILLCLNSVLMGGFYLACLRRQRGESVSPTEVFCGFKVAFAQLLLAGLVSGLLIEVSVCCLILPFIFLAVAWFFAVPLVADKKLFFWAGMELSRKVVTRVWFEMFVLLLIAFLPMLLFQVYSLFETYKLGLSLWDQSGHNMQQLAQIFGTQSSVIAKFTVRTTLIGQGVLLINLFYSTGVIIRAYENLFGARKS